MIEKVICNYLKKNIGINAYPEKPLRPPDKFILVERTGGSEKNHIMSATIAIQSYAPSMYMAAELNESVKDAMRNITKLGEIGGAHLNNDAPFTDVDTKSYRYQAVYLIKYFS